MADFGGGGFLGAVGGVVAGIAGFLRGMVNITVSQLLRLVQYLRDALVKLSKEMLSAVWRAGKALARALVSLGRLAYGGLKQFVLWADRKLRALERWLKDIFGPVLARLKWIKDHIDEFYKRFVRPIIDTIEFIRQINRVLNLFHIKVLNKLDTTLQQIEARIDEPFLWVRAHITELQNIVSRVMTLDGFFQKLTLIRSLERYAPAWIHTFWVNQIGPAKATTPPADSPSGYPPHQVLEDVNALNDYWIRGDGDHATRISELSLMFLQALKTTPDRGV